MIPPPPTQTERIKAHLEAGHTLTPLEALDRFQCFRLAARIKDLRNDGMEIECEKVDVGGGKRVAQYRKKAFALEFSD